MYVGEPGRLTPPFEFLQEVYGVAKDAHAAIEIAGVWEAQCRLQDLKRYFAEHSVDYLIRHSEYVDDIASAFTLARYHLAFCEASLTKEAES